MASSISVGARHQSRSRPVSAGARARFGVIGEALARPLASYYIVLTTAIFLVTLGALMVLSSSSVYSQATNDGNPWFIAQRQLVFLVVGVVLAAWLSRLQEKMLRVMSWVAMIGAVVLLLAVFVPGLGSDAGKGNHAWLRLGPISLQPSEFAKVALVMWAAAVIANKEKVIDRPRELMSLLGGFAIVLGLVLAEKDLGTAMVVGMICFGVLWIIGIPMRMLASLAFAGALAVAALVVTVPNRMIRITSFLGLAEPDPNASQQPMSAIYALATGGWWGVGLGGSRQKWGNLNDAAQNDFVFAVLGDEMGLLGTVLVIGLFAVLGYVGVRIALRSDSTYNRVLCGGITVWLLFQAMVNMGVAMKMLPVLGVPLPFISAGGSALLANLMAVGLLASCARQEPAARRALARRRGQPRPRVTTVVDGQ